MISDIHHLWKQDTLFPHRVPGAQDPGPTPDVATLVRMVEALSVKLDALESKISSAPNATHEETPEASRRTIERLLGSVRVLRPRKPLAVDFVDNALETASLSSIARAVFDCYDIPWKKEASALTLEFSPFVTDTPERREFLEYSRALLRRLTGQLPPLPEQKGTLITGPVGCGKSTLAGYLALSIASITGKALVVHFECIEDMQGVLFWHIMAAGLVKAGVATIDDVVKFPFSFAHLKDLLEPGTEALLFTDETQLMFRPKDVDIRIEGRTTSRSMALFGNVKSMESRWPRSIVSGSASSLFNLFFDSGRCSPSDFPSKMPELVNRTKFTNATVKRLASSSSVEAIVGARVPTRPPSGEGSSP